MSNYKDLSRRVAALATSVQNLTRQMIGLNDRLYSHEAAEGEVLAKAVNMAPTGDARLESRVAHLEELARLMTLPGGVADGEKMLAKAAGVYADPTALMALGEREISDATTMGIFSSHIAFGNLTAAQNTLIDVRERSRFAKAADAAQMVESALDTPLNDFNNRVGVSELTARFASMERLLASLEARLDQLDRRPQAAPVVPGERVVVKAANTGKKRRLTHEEESNHLLSMLDRYVDSPTTAGQISSMIQAGKHAEVRPILERAKAAHETAKIRQERQSWDK